MIGKRKFKQKLNESDFSKNDLALKLVGDIGNDKYLLCRAIELIQTVLKFDSEKSDEMLKRAVSLIVLYRVIHE